MNETNKVAKQWPHAPVHWLFREGLYFVTARTHKKEPHFLDCDRRDLLLDHLLAFAAEFDWQLEAWAVMSNHYHFIARSPDDPSTLRKFLSKLHMKTGQHVNELDGTPGRRVWFQYWDTELSYPESYFARLHYVHTNPVHHGLVSDAQAYRWCSARWFCENSPAAFVKSICSFKIDRLNIRDDF